MSKKIQDIVAAIKAGRCVLVLGPEICQIDYNRFVKDDAIQNIPKDFDESLKIAYDYYLEHILDDQDRKNIEAKGERIQFVDYPFLKEQLMTSASSNNQNHVYDFAKWYFNQSNDWDEHFSKIANIPFPLVLSMLPDNNLEIAYRKTIKDSQKYQVSRYSRENQEVAEITEKPSQESPLLYKLLGDIETFDATFTFDDWFDYFANIFGANPLPTAIAAVLKDYPLILFLGVRVEKWYIQLLIRLLISKGNKDKGKKFAFVNAKENDIHELAHDRFNLVFDDTQPVELLEQLYLACEKENLLRQKTSHTPNQMNANIFISYNHADTEIAHRLKVDLEKEGLIVIIDSDNPIGFAIPTFINESLRKADFILQLISANFLTSAWVAQESVRAFTLAELTGKVVLPCQLDSALSDTDFRNRAMETFDSKAKEFATQMTDRLLKGESVSDLQAQYQRMLELKNSYDNTIAEFRNKNRGDLRGDNYTKGLEQIIKSIRTYQSRT